MFGAFFRKNPNWDSPMVWKELGIRPSSRCKHCGKKVNDEQNYCNEIHRLKDILIHTGHTHELMRAIRMEEEKM